VLASVSVLRLFRAFPEVGSGLFIETADRENDEEGECF
jgi:hypothetical protein